MLMKILQQKNFKETFYIDTKELAENVKILSSFKVIFKLMKMAIL